MAAIRAMRGTAYADDHFEPEAALDPHAQRRIRGHLEQVDYMAFASNGEVFAQALGPTKIESFQRLALATAKARARWVTQALELTSAGTPTPEQARELRVLREAYEELAEAYEALRRLVERGYVAFLPPEPPPSAA
ncbi:MAG TPA: hypothetical protein VKU90_16200 [Caulobacteraceae bacterium]|jgi:hypothetical protein|nr:hypothetical protein [Caulobacteraceae bacterium]